MGVVCFSGPAVQLSTTRFTQSNSIGILGSKIISFGCEIISLKIFVTFFNIIFLHHLKYTNRYAVIRNSKPKSNFLYPEKTTYYGLFILQFLWKFSRKSLYLYSISLWVTQSKKTFKKIRVNQDTRISLARKILSIQYASPREKKPTKSAESRNRRGNASKGSTLM